MLRIIALALTCAFSIYAQTSVGSPVNPSTTPPSVQTTEFLFLDGGNAYVEYACTALRVQPRKYWAYASGELSGIVDSSGTATITFASAHGFDTTRSVGARIRISGATDPDLNGDFYIQSVPSTTTVTITTENVTDATYTTGLSVSSNAPRTTEPIWTIYKFVNYSASLATGKRSSDPNSICNNRAVTTGATAVFYQ